MRNFPLHIENPNHRLRYVLAVDVVPITNGENNMRVMTIVAHERGVAQNMTEEDNATPPVGLYPGANPCNFGSATEPGVPPCGLYQWDYAYGNPYDPGSAGELEDKLNSTDCHAASQCGWVDHVETIDLPDYYQNMSCMKDTLFWDDGSCSNNYAQCSSSVFHEQIYPSMMDHFRLRIEQMAQNWFSGGVVLSYDTYAIYPSGPGSGYFPQYPAIKAGAVRITYAVCGTEPDL